MYCFMNEKDLIKDMLPEVFAQRKEVINLIPDVKPNNAINLLRKILFSDIENEMFADHTFAENPDPLFELLDGEAELSELAHPNGMSERIVITTIGAKLLIRLFKSGLVEQKKKSSPVDLSLLEAYANSLPELKVKSDKLKKTREEKKARGLSLNKDREERIKHLLIHPEDARRDELSKEFLNKYAFAIGPGSQSFKFAGAHVTKRVQTLSSNSGKTSRTYVSIKWSLPDGSVHGDANIEPVLNRRNDPSRNWGLGR